MTSVCVTFDTATNERLAREAEGLGVSKSAALRMILKKFWSSFGGLTL